MGALINPGVSNWDQGKLYVNLDSDLHTLIIHMLRCRCHATHEIDFKSPDQPQFQFPHQIEILWVGPGYLFQRLQVILILHLRTVFISNDFKGK